jgi:hypothetical protein
MDLYLIFYVFVFRFALYKSSMKSTVFVDALKNLYILMQFLHCFHIKKMNETCMNSELLLNFIRNFYEPFSVWDMLLILNEKCKNIEWNFRETSMKQCGYEVFS